MLKLEVPRALRVRCAEADTHIAGYPAILTQVIVQRCRPDVVGSTQDTLDVP